MSFMKKLTGALKTGQIPNVSSVADSLVGKSKSDSPFAVKEITDDMLTPAQRQLSRMEWDWRESGQAANHGTGAAVRNWETAGRDAQRDLILMWSPVGAVEEYLLVLAWRGWAMALIQRDSRMFRPEYVDALFADRLATVRVVHVKSSDVANNALCIPAGGNGFYFAKLITRTASGDYVEVKDYSLGSAERRKEKNLPAAPTDELFRVAAPAGTREPNAEEKTFERK